MGAVTVSLPIEIVPKLLVMVFLGRQLCEPSDLAVERFFMGQERAFTTKVELSRALRVIP
jgi:hypothetical protein